MIGIVYLGNNPQTEERLKYIPGRLVQLTKTYKDAATACAPHVRNEHFLVFFEKNVRTEDITAITYLRKKCSNIYIILLTEPLSGEERDVYQKCGINDTLSVNASVTELNKKIQFISDRESIMFMTKYQRSTSCISRFLCGNVCLTSSSLGWPSSFCRRFSLLPQSPSSWKVPDRFCSSQNG